MNGEQARMEPAGATHPIEDYALIGDTQAAALVGRDGSLDWLCLPRFDSPACFSALLGGEQHGRWRIAPREPSVTVSRRYLPGTLVLETTFETGSGTVELVDFMPPRGEAPDVIRLVRGRAGSVPVEMEFAASFDYGSVAPWLTVREGELTAVGGPDALSLHGSVPIELGEGRPHASFTVGSGETVAFVLTWYPSHQAEPRRVDAGAALVATTSWWEEWSAACRYQGEWRDEVLRSLIVLKALTYSPTGGIVAAPTTSLPEVVGGVRNWDYRYCWLRDATLTLLALLDAGFDKEAAAWRDWLLRAVAGDPADLRIMYGVAGERRLTELELPWLPGYEGSAPVRIGNAASTQLQLDVYGEILDAMHQSRRKGLAHDEHAWNVQIELLRVLETSWREPDAGIWEVRGPRRHFTHSKVMCWVGFDRAVKAVEQFGLPGPVARWRALRDEVHAQVCDHGYDPRLGAFVQSYGSDRLDASLLLLPIVGFLPPDDPRVAGTVEAIRRDLCEDGLVLRYREDPQVDGLPGKEGAFLACSFWLVDCLALVGRREEARELFERLLGLANDVGLLAEEFDPATGRLLGNFPQGFSHLALVGSAIDLAAAAGPVPERQST